MSTKIITIKSFAEMGFYRLSNITKDLTEHHLDWTSCSEANTIRTILTHLNQELHVYIPRMLIGKTPDAWPDDYTGNTSYSLEKIMNDLTEGKTKLYKMLDDTTDEALEKEVDMFMGKRPLQFYVTLMISEIIHHEGQIAAILGVERRMNPTGPQN